MIYPRANGHEVVGHQKFIRTEKDLPFTGVDFV
jgi:hypothetical protein